MDPGPVKHQSDINLATLTTQGSVPAWHEFVVRYSGLIRLIVRRYHTWKQEEDQRNAYVEILEYMFSEGLSRYDGRAALSTWVMTVSRSRCLDMIRRESGRKREPKWLEQCSPLDRRIYRLYYNEFRSVPAVIARLAAQGHLVTSKMLDEALARLEARMDRGLQKKLAYDLQARSTGALSGRMLELLDNLRLEQESRAEAQRPDVELFQKRTRLLMEEIGRCVSLLGDPEKSVIELRFYDEMSAPGIARRLSLSGPRRVYALIDRALHLMRDRLEMRFGRSFRSGGNLPVEDIFRRL